MLKWLGGLALVLALAAGGFAIYKAITKLEAKVEEVDARADKTIAEKEVAIAALLAENVKLREKDAAAEAAKTRLQTDLAKARLENDKLREDLKTAPPETVLATVQGYLNTTEIWLRSNAANQVEAVFSLAAFRTNADALADRHYLKFTLVPNLESQLRISEGQNSTKATVISNLETMLTDSAVIISEKDDKIAVRDDAISILKKANLWREIRDFGFGYLVATILNLIFGK